MDRSDVSYPIHIQLNRHNYVLWAQAISSFLKGRRLWRYITGHITEPVKANDDTDEKFADRLEEWDSKNHQIITWFRNTSIPSIHL